MTIGSTVAGWEGGGTGAGAVPVPRDGAAAPEKNVLKPWQKQEWCIPQVSADFVAQMEDVLDLYAEPYDPQRPVVCFDETSTQLLAETRPPMPPRPGLPLRQDYEYRREGTRNLFLACEPLAGWRPVTQRRTMQAPIRCVGWWTAWDAGGHGQPHSIVRRPCTKLYGAR